MTNELQVFSYEENEVRTVEIDGETWFVLKDVCRALDLNDTNKVAERLEDDELTRIKFVSGGQNREMYATNESGLYNVILRSDKPEAKKFKRWITHEVLPEIRKTGGYAPVKERDPNLIGATEYMEFLTKRMENQGRNPYEIAEMVELVAKRYGLPIPGDFVREAPFEQIRFTYNVPKAAEVPAAAY